MNINRWIELIYNERDFGRGVATTVAGVTGLVIYLYQSDWAIAVFSAIIIFPVIKIVATSIHSHWVRSRQRTYSREQMAELFEKLSSEEQAVVQAFVRHGGSVVTWGEVNRSPHFSAPGIESLVNRSLVQSTVTVDGMTEAFALDTELFDYAQAALPNKPV